MFAREKVWRALARGLFAVSLATGGIAEAAGPPVRIGLDADMSGESAQSGDAIRRGATVAIAEINAAGGVLGRPLELIVLDHRGIPSRGLDNIEIFSTMTGLVGIIGGVHTPVAVHELEALHKYRIVYLGAWASGTQLVDNGYNPNYVFRAALRDSLAGGFLVDTALKAGYRNPALLLMETGWGRSNEKAMTTALHTRGLKPTATEWFRWGAKSLVPQIERIIRAGADVIIMVAGAREGPVAVRDIAARPAAQRLPIISHSGIAGSEFVTDTGPALNDVNLRFLQTYSFIDPPFPDRAKRFLATYRKLFPDDAGPEKIQSPPGVAHAYDLVHLLARAIEKAGTIDRAAVRDALERLGRHEGLVRNYDPPFTPDRHDALTAEDFFLARFGKNGVIVPEGR